MAEPENGLARHASTVEERDEELLAELGYKQELRRDWGLMHNFGISFSIIVCFRNCSCLALKSYTDFPPSQSSLVSRHSSHMVSILEVRVVGLLRRKSQYLANEEK